MFFNLLQRLCVCLALSFLLAAWATSEAHAEASEASALSLLPVALVSAAPTAVLASGAALTVVGIEASAEGAVWVLERARDGARASIRFGGQASVAVGTSVAVSAIAGGWLLSAAGQAIACVPDAAGASLLYNERVTR